jgi:hypothetical protein
VTSHIAAEGTRGKDMASVMIVPRVWLRDKAPF